MLLIAIALYLASLVFAVSLAVALLWLHRCLELWHWHPMPVFYLLHKAAAWHQLPSSRVRPSGPFAAGSLVLCWVSARHRISFSWLWRCCLRATPRPWSPGALTACHRRKYVVRRPCAQVCVPQQLLLHHRTIAVQQRLCAVHGATHQRAEMTPPRVYLTLSVKLTSDVR